MGSGPGRPVKTHGPPHGHGGAAHIEPTSHGPRPGPAHHIFNFSRPGPARPINFSIFHGPARPGPSIFQKSRPGPARPITFSEVLARPGPARHNFQIGPVRPGPDKRPMTSPGIYACTSKYVCVICTTSIYHPRQRVQAFCLTMLFCVILRFFQP